MTVLRGRNTAVVMLALASAAVSPCTATARSATSRQGQWCGAPVAADLVCALAGRVLVAPPATPPYRAATRAHLVEPGSKVVVSRRGEAHISFMRQATCALGVVTEPTEIVTRFGAQDALFWQAHGQSLCTFASGTRKKLGLFCELATAGECPVIVSTDGTTQFVTHTSNPAVMEFCSGAFTIRIGNPTDYAEVSASASEQGRVRVSVSESESATRTESPSETVVNLGMNISLAVTLSNLEGPGPCSSAVFRQQRRLLQG